MTKRVLIELDEEDYLWIVGFGPRPGRQPDTTIEEIADIVECGYVQSIDFEDERDPIE